jgi:hypothetical protein
MADRILTEYSKSWLKAGEDAAAAVEGIPPDEGDRGTRRRKPPLV